MRYYSVAVLAGDGIGPEVTAEAELVLQAVAETFGWGLTLSPWLIGGAAWRQFGSVFPANTRAAVVDSDAVLLGAVGDPALDKAPPGSRPEVALLGLRRILGVYANLRPVRARAALASSSPLKADLIRGADVLIVRELTGGLYYGEPRGRYGSRAVNTLTYDAAEIERVARKAFEAARNRGGLVTSVDKANVLEVSQLWREIVTTVAAEYPTVTLEHRYVDAFAMQLITDPTSFDVVLTENMFGDILSDEAAVLAGSLGLLPSASLGEGPGLFEPIHGSAPALSGKGIANPIGAILSGAMLLRYALGQPEAAELVEHAVDEVVERGARTADLAHHGERTLTTREMGQLIVERVRGGAPAHAAS